MENSKIQWTDATFNPWSGCTKVADGCKFCYAEVNYSVKMRGVKWGPQGNRIRAADSMWKQPLTWNRAAEKSGERKRVFCASLADVFEDWGGEILNSKGQRLWFQHEGGSHYFPDHDVTTAARKTMRLATMDDLRRDLFDLIEKTPWLDWQILTKRPENIRRMIPGRSRCASWPNCTHPFCIEDHHYDNLWLGTSIARQHELDANLPELLKCCDLASVLFLSAEPLLESIDFHLGECLLADDHYETCERLHWIIFGGESGAHARPCDIEWIRHGVRQCDEHGVAAFVKQLGSDSFMGVNGFGPVLKDGKGGDIAEWPEDIRVRQMPGAEMPA